MGVTDWYCGVCDTAFTNRADREVHLLTEGHLIVPRITTVVNVQTDEFDVYIGRNPKFGETTWGNPFKLTNGVTREQAVAQYREWIQNQPYLMEKLPGLRGLRLGCHCAPQLCHGNVLAQLANEMEVRELDITCIVCHKTVTFPYDKQYGGMRIDLYANKFQANICGTCRPDTTIISGTGSRAFSLNGPRFNALADEVIRVKARYPKLVIMSGGATGFDEALAKLAIAHQIPLVLVMPNRAYPGKYWGAKGKDQARLGDFHDMEDAAQCVIWLDGTPNARNLHMIQLADFFWVDKVRALDNSQFNGTRHCYQCLCTAGKVHKFID